jgi:subfamily B ATP-binding cassette protein MsbA
MAGRTVIVIAHRLSTVRRATRIVVLERGRITDIGSHEELLQTSATYQKLYRLQFMDIGETSGIDNHIGGNEPEPTLEETLPGAGATEPALTGKVER